MECQICQQEIPAVMVEAHARAHRDHGETMPSATTEADETLNATFFWVYCVMVGVTFGVIFSILH